MGGRPTIRIKCSRSVFESEGLINTIIYSLILSLIIMTVAGYARPSPKETSEQEQNPTSGIDPVYLKCFITVPDDNNDRSPRTGHTHKPHTTPSKMKRKYQKRKRRSDDEEELSEEYEEIWGLNFINCSVYPSHKVNP